MEKGATKIGASSSPLEIANFNMHGKICDRLITEIYGVYNFF